ncbi:peptide ABC transporter substrate-binding protein [Dongshaea marina]|uniref:peptide ABC transporter substrate-binding protein n=1 Tax=Dongshaea marina TaxID=2047966 RepID=UPI000D3E113A|nr:peptide ABC transporter substrate-binding protein [Dongshaea marina]
MSPNPLFRFTLFCCALFSLGLSTLSQAEATSPSTQLAKVQQLIRGNRAEPATLDPQKVEGVPASNILADLFEGLVSIGPQGMMVPGIATHWENSNNQIYTFHLRHAKWSDGTPLTAKDFVFAWRRAVDPKLASPYSWFVQEAHITNADAIVNGKLPPSKLGVEALDPYTLKVELSQPVPYFVQMLANTTFYPVPQKVVEKYGEKWTRPEHMVSDGAYQLKSWVVNEKIVAVRNPYYWNNSQTHINQVTYLPVTKPNTEVNRYMAGGMDMTYQIPTDPAQYHRLKEDMGNELQTSGVIGNYYYSFNMKRKPLNDVRVRKALAYAIDREIIAKDVLGEGQLAAYTFTPPATAGFTKPSLPWEKWSQKELDQKALTLMKQAGYGPEHPLKVTLLYSPHGYDKKIALAIASMWKKLGIDVSLNNQEWKVYLDTLKQFNFDIAVTDWYGDYNEPSTFLGLLLCGNPQNNSAYCNKEYDSIYQHSARLTTARERAQSYDALEEIINRDMPVAPIFDFVTTRLVKPYVGGYSDNPLDKVYTRKLYIKAHQVS